MLRTCVSLVCGVLLALGVLSVEAQPEVNPYRLKHYETGDVVEFEGESYLVICSTLIRGVPAERYALVHVYPMEHGRPKRKKKPLLMVREPHNPVGCYPQPPATYVEQAVAEQNMRSQTSAPQGTPEAPPPKPPQ